MAGMRVSSWAPHEGRNNPTCQQRIAFHGWEEGGRREQSDVVPVNDQVLGGVPFFGPFRCDGTAERHSLASQKVAC